MLGERNPAHVVCRLLRRVVVLSEPDLVNHALLTIDEPEVKFVRALAVGAPEDRGDGPAAIGDRAFHHDFAAASQYVIDY